MSPLFHTFSTLALQPIAQSHSFLDALPYMMGMLVVMVALAILWGICAATGWLTYRLMPAARPKSADSSPKPSQPAAEPQAKDIAEDPNEISPEILAVIAAAVATTVGKPHRIISIKPMSTSWERAGRQSVLTSHRIR
ncbi:MAG TPA: OadG family protein [Luteolibacter sp.]|nr:OadG family protein [Luteolibacter sp.]